MYVCLKTLCLSWKMYVCMFEALKRVCMYASNIHTYIQTLNQRCVAKIAVSKGCLTAYVCLKSLCLSWKMKHTRSNMHPQKPSKSFKKLIQGAFEHVCMFEHPLPVIENETYTFNIHAQFSFNKSHKTHLRRLFIMYVCLKTLCLSWKTKHTRSNMNLRTQLKL